MRERIIELMKATEPKYKTWTDVEINKQIDAIFECGYLWVNNGNSYGFRHKESGLFLNIPNLNFYKPEQIKETYARVWSKTVDRVKAVVYLKNLIQGIFILIVVIIIGLIFLDTMSTLLLVGLISMYLIYNYSKYYKLTNKTNDALGNENNSEGINIDVSEIPWCENCVYYKRVKKWENSTYNLSSELLAQEFIPCKNYDITKQIWFEYFNTPTGDRYLYPKNCGHFKRNKK